LNDACARDRQATRKLAGGARHARQALKDDHANRVTEHPSDENDMHELYLMTDDLDMEIRALKAAGVECDSVSQQSWGRSTRIQLPGGTLGLYEPRHERP
jgi:hypothetical protein